MQSKPYKVERSHLVNYYPTIIFRMIEENVVRNDIIKGGEFILTAQDILDQVEQVEGRFVRDENGKAGIGMIPASQIAIVYNQN